MVLASPEIAVALSLAGRLSFDPQTDTLTGKDGKPFKLTVPATAPEVPAKGFTPGVSAYVAPPEDGSTVKVEIPPTSERLQAIEPWAEWNGMDIGNAPVLMKTKGKTTTDDISPAGSWLRYRGHLGRFSDNLLLTAVDLGLGWRFHERRATLSLAWQGLRLRFGADRFGSGAHSRDVSLGWAFSF
mgnify:CR=1 FL=1